jgi:hypothetical protein
VLSGAALPGGLVLPAKGSSTEEILEDYPLLEPKVSKPISCTLNAANPQPNDRGGLEAFIGTASALSRRAEQCDFVTFGDDELG